jgi:four helix bundle protein
MGTIRRFEELEICQMARALNNDIVPLLLKLQECKSFDLKSQLDDAMGSVMDNIAEGFERDGNREFIQFLAVSKGSLGESRSQLYRSFDRNYLTTEELTALQGKCLTLASKIANFMTYLRNSGHRGPKFRE